MDPDVCVLEAQLSYTVAVEALEATVLQSYGGLFDAETTFVRIFGWGKYYLTSLLCGGATKEEHETGCAGGTVFADLLICSRLGGGN